MSSWEFSRLSALLDESLDLAPADRHVWLIELQRTDPTSAAILRDVFALQDDDRAQGFLETNGALASQAAAMLDADSALIGKRFGSYRVVSLLGHGGMGSVWLAERVDGLFARRIALKLVHSALMSRVTSERFAREREILASLNHPNIARLIDAGIAEDGQPYLALEFVTGMPFTTYCDEHRLPIRERLELFGQVLGAVHYAHAHLVIHRDLKPANILVTEDSQVRLLDFGIAKLLSEAAAKETELTQFGGRAFTPDYAAPEQISGAPITTATDVYALGVMLYELLTGERPYRLKRDSRGELEEAILQADPVAPSRAALSEIAAAARATTVKKLASALKGDLNTITIKALKKVTAERYATANAFGEDIARFLGGDVVLAQPDRVSYRALKFARRHWVGLAAFAVLVLTLAGGLAATSYEARLASQQRDAALEARFRSLTQTAAGHLKDADVPGALGIILEILPRRGADRTYTPEALSVFQEARAADIQLLVLAGHTDRVRSAAFSADGQRIVTASADKTARVWDALSGRQTLLLSGHTKRVNSATFSPDGHRIVTSSADTSARIWDATTGQQLMLLAGHGDRVHGAAFSPDGQRVATASYDKTARIWDAATGREITVLNGHTDTVCTVAFSPDGGRVVTASYDKTARIWDAATGRQITILSGHLQSLADARFSPDGSRIVTASDDKTARIWNVATGREMLVLKGHSLQVDGANFSPDGDRVVTASDDNTARVWDATTGRQILLLFGHGLQVESAAFSPDGQSVVTASDDRTARVWDVGMGRELIRLRTPAQVDGVAFSPDGLHIVTGSDDNTARIWNIADGREILRLTGHTQLVNGVDFSPDGERVATASVDKTARIWEAATGRNLLVLRGHGDPVEDIQFSPDGKRVVTASLDKTARIWDAGTGREITVLTGHTDRLASAAFSPDGRRIVTVSVDKTARIWDAATGRELLLLRGHTDRLISGAFSPDGGRVLTASHDKTARIWDAAAGRQLMVLSGNAQILSDAKFSPDGRHVVTASADTTARIWDAGTGQQLAVLCCHTDLLESVAFSPDGSRIATASDDMTVRIWDAHTPDLETQLEWAQAAQYDLLSSTERFQFGLDNPADMRQWPRPQSQCDELAAAPYDPGRRAPGLMLGDVITDLAVAACANSKIGPRDRVRATYQHGRALMANGEFLAARRDFETALARGYLAARIELGMLLSQPSAAGVADLPRAISLLEQAWRDSLSMAAFQLGGLYEHGVLRAVDIHEYLLAPDNAQAWLWYRRAADAGEPNALARFAERLDEAASAEANVFKKGAIWLESFKYYAAAVERARIEDWPEEAWRNWRYRRASLAHLLARQGKMREVAEVYKEVSEQYAPPPTPWKKLFAFLKTGN
jgi:WD40 repeat protein/tRNA A-37 threonylcarbamoyl transferase component Bud32